MSAGIQLRSPLPDGVLVVGSDPVRLTWSVDHAAGTLQEAYELEVSRTPTFDDLLVPPEVMESGNQIGVLLPGPPLLSREVRFVRVRIRTASGWTQWSNAQRVEAGLLLPTDWSAAGIGPVAGAAEGEPPPASLLRRSFELPTVPPTARLYATALGVMDLRLNGLPVAHDLLAPGWTPYRKRLTVEAYDVTPFLVAGENVLSAALGDGWFRGRLGWSQVRAHYGSEVALVTQLEMTWSDASVLRVVTDLDWKASTGEIRSADLYDGAVVDLRLAQPGWDSAGFDDAAWKPVRIVEVDFDRFVPRLASPVRAIATIPASIEPRPDGTVLLRATQNIAGYVRPMVRGRAGEEITLRHAEVLEPDGALHTRSLRTARAEDRFTLASSDPVRLAPAFTFHGFQYASLATEGGDVLDAEFVAISSALRERGRFRSSHAGLNKLYENVLWSLRDNFVSIPTDCPQRDERLGWTGDAQAFAPTACLLVESEAFWLSWLRDLALEQDPVLGVPSVVPDVVLDGIARYGRAGWADAATIVPWAVYQAYGDLAVLRQQFDSMVNWVESLVGRQSADGLLEPSWQFGDWLDPDAPPDEPWLAKADSEFLANAFFAHSARLTARAADVLGQSGEATRFSALADLVAVATWERWASHAVTNQTGCAAALQLGIAPEPERAAVADRLATLVRDANGAVATGFLGTPLVLHALAEGGHFDEAYSMLLRREAPSWLHQVDHGATTVWERWDAIRADGSIHPGTMKPPPDLPSNEGGGHMLSFNHYAYGAVVDWMFRHLAGLASDEGGPGYRRIRIAPRPVHGVESAGATVATAHGDCSVDWEVTATGLQLRVTIPFGSVAALDLPTSATSDVLVNGSPERAADDLGPGSHTITITEPAVARPPADSARATTPDEAIIGA
jgi:alpha-L-rhamnosidase